MAAGPVVHMFGRRWMGWLMLVATALAMVIGLEDARMLRQPNRFLQDTLMAWKARAVHDSEVVIVAIDEKSLAALGPWPWRRTSHAALIDRIMQGAPKAIGLDIQLTELDALHPGDDKALADALKRSGKVVLPMALQSNSGNPRIVQPIASLSKSANSVGLDRLPLRDDGVVRDVYLREGLSGFELDHFSLAILKVGDARYSSENLPGSPDAEEFVRTPLFGQWLEWRRSHKVVVPFAGPPGHFRRISYVDVLSGSVPSATFRGKYVLVGTTASALSSLYATPVSRRDHLMPGIEINANVLDGLLRQQSMSPAPRWLNTGVNLSIVLLALFSMAFFEPLIALLLTGALALLLLLVTALGNAMLHLQFAPVAGMLVLGGAYSFWSWCKLNAATHYLIDASMHLRANVEVAQSQKGRRHFSLSGDFFDQRIRALEQATEHLRDLHRFVSDSLDGLPDVTLVCDRRGKVQLANAVAAHYFNAAAGIGLKSASAVELMRHVRSFDGHQPVVTEDLLAQPPLASVVSARDEQTRHLLVKLAPSLNAKGLHVGWILSLVDVTQLHLTQRQRDSAMHFLSHDIRAPQSAILTLLALRRHDPQGMTQEQFEVRIERHARKALALSDGFIQLVQAQTQRYNFVTCNLTDLLLECIDDTWETQQRRKVKVVMTQNSNETLSQVDRDLVSRALGNLLGNALKHSPLGSTITCSIDAHPGGWAVLVQDQGPGIDLDMQASVFEPFSRIHSSVRVDGAGLGLAFVKTVAIRHDGMILLSSTPGCGCSFRLVLPRAPCEAAVTAPDELPVGVSLGSELLGLDHRGKMS